MSTGGAIINYYEQMDDKFKDKQLPNPNFHLHNFNIPFRMCVVAPSGSGKTTNIINMIHLFSLGKGTFANIYIICKDASESLYRFIASKSDQIQVLEGLVKLPNLDKIDKEIATLVIIDDMVLEKNQEKVSEYYVRCRKKNVSVAYLSQSYFLIPKIIRSNCNYLVLLKLSGDRELNLILKESGLGLNKECLLSLYEYATRDKFYPLIIDIESTDKNRKYRRGFGEYMNPSDFGC